MPVAFGPEFNGLCLAMLRYCPCVCVCAATSVCALELTDCSLFEFLASMLTAPPPGTNQLQKKSADTSPLRVSVVVISRARSSARANRRRDVGVARRSLAKTTEIFAQLTLGHPRRHEGVLTTEEELQKYRMIRITTEAPLLYKSLNIAPHLGTVHF